MKPKIRYHMHGVLDLIFLIFGGLICVRLYNIITYSDIPKGDKLISAILVFALVLSIYTIFTVSGFWNDWLYYKQKKRECKHKIIKNANYCYVCGENV